MYTQESWLNSEKLLWIMSPQPSQTTWPPVFRKRNNIATICVLFVLIAAFLMIIQYDAAITYQNLEVSVETMPRIPRKIWQIFLPPINARDRFVIDPERLSDTATWLAINPDYTYKLVGLTGANNFVDQHYGDDPSLHAAYYALQNPGLKSDLLRYLILSVEGGTYTDTDTVALKSIDDWVPEEIRHLVRVVVGIEFDRLDGGRWAEIPHEVQFCQWTISAVPNHTLFGSMINRALSSLRGLESTYNTTLGELKPTSFEVMNSTGPAAWTDVVFSYLQQADPSLVSTRNLSGLTQPALYGDILILPIDGFGMGQPHSRSTNDGTIPDTALLRHNFRGSWRGE
ncbi:family 32 glycosyltransferase [Xylariaceae sp. FL0662B]|nr:family 32 glycosyltransferase [Xylariaceae sp. FL0662B]